MRQNQDEGAAYGATVLSVVAILFITFVIPYGAAFSINLAYSSSTPFEATNPDALYWAGGTGPYGPIEETTYHNVASNESFQWVNWVDNPENSPGFSKDCEPYDWANAQTGYPSTNYSVTMTYATNITNTTAAKGNAFQYMWMDNPFRTQGGGLCTTLGDEIGVRIYPPLGARWGNNASWFTPSGRSSGMAMTSFNAYYTQMNANDLYAPGGAYSYNTSAYASFDWWVEINGAYMFGESVRAGDPDSLVLDMGTFTLLDGSIIGSDDVYLPTVKFRHDLNPLEEKRVRDATAGKSTSEVNMTLNFICYSTSGTQATLPVGNVNEACEIWNMDVASSSNADSWFLVSATFIEADDYDFFIQTSALLMSILMFVIAIASTPAWNPFKRLLMSGGGR